MAEINQPILGLKKCHGVYKIIHTSGKIYIGSSFNILNRIRTHIILLKGNKHHNKPLQNYYNKYGINSFNFEIIEEIYFNCQYDSNYKREFLDCVEQYYLDKYDKNNLFNTAFIVNSPTVKRTKESLEKARQTRKIRNTKMSEITKRKISSILKNSEKCKLANRKIAENRKKSVYQYDLDGNFIKEWKNRDEVIFNLNIKKSTLNSCIYKRMACHGYIFLGFKVNNLKPYTKKVGRPYGNK